MRNIKRRKKKEERERKKEEKQQKRKGSRLALQEVADRVWALGHMLEDLPDNGLLLSLSLFIIIIVIVLLLFFLLFNQTK